MTTAVLADAESETRSRQLRNLIAEIILVALVGWGTLVLDRHGQAEPSAAARSNEAAPNAPAAPR